MNKPVRFRHGIVDLFSVQSNTPTPDCSTESGEKIRKSSCCVMCSQYGVVNNIVILARSMTQQCKVAVKRHVMQIYLLLRHKHCL